MTIDKIKEQIVSAGKYVSENATLATSKANIKITLKAKNDALNAMYANLGKEHFNSLTKKEKNKYKDILALEEEVNRLNNELAAINESKVCQKCGTKVTKDIKFCSECGSKVN